MRAAMNAGFFDDWSSEGRPADYYRAAAEGARRLHAEATTPWLKQYLSEIIAQCELLAGEVASGSEDDLMSISRGLALR
jgi:hypothetical protein